MFQSELHAISKAASFVMNAGNVAQRIIIYSDSRSALQALGRSKVKSAQLHSVMLLLNHVAASNTVVLRWVKAHVGHAGNELADEQAKQGAVSRLPSDEEAPLTANNIRRNKLRDKIVLHWEEHWRALHPCRQTKLFFPFTNKKLSVQTCSCDRRTFSVCR